MIRANRGVIVARTFPRKTFAGSFALWTFRDRRYSLLREAKRRAEIVKRGATLYITAGPTA